MGEQLSEIPSQLGKSRVSPLERLRTTTRSWAWRGPTWLIRGMRSGLEGHSMDFEGMSSGLV
jgi:hypothetical protein